MPGEIPAAKQISQKIHYLEDRLSTHKVVYETEKGILLPGLRFKHIQPKGPAVLYVPANGLPQDGKLPAWLKHKYEKHHQEIWMFDLRGLGETSPSVAKKPGYFGADQKEAFLSLHIGRPLLGQRTLDVLSLLKMIGGDKVQLVGSGTTGPIVLHAAALDARVREVTVAGGKIAFWETVVSRPITRNQLANVVPGVLKRYDLSDLMQSLRRRVEFHDVEVLLQPDQP
jgi:pimeloyl-ACP methyl ester carboxylesterase